MKSLEWPLALLFCVLSLVPGLAGDSVVIDAAALQSENDAASSASTLSSPEDLFRHCFRHCPLLVGFVSLSCRFCAGVVPELSSANSHLRLANGGSQSGYAAVVYGDDSPDLLKLFSVSKYPTILLVANSHNDSDSSLSYLEYTGNIRASEMVNFYNANEYLPYLDLSEGPSSHSMVSSLPFYTSGNPTVYGCSLPAELKASFKEAANRCFGMCNGVRFVLLHDERESFCGAEGEGESGVYFQGSRYDAASGLGLYDWVALKGGVLVKSASPDNMDQYFAAGTSVLALFFGSEHESDEGSFRQVMTDFAMSLHTSKSKNSPGSAAPTSSSRKNYTYLVVPPSMSTLSKFLNVTRTPALLLVETSQSRMQKYIYNGALEPTPLVAWLESIESGAVTPNYRSTAPSEHDVSPSGLITGHSSNYQSLVLESPLPALVVFHADWCGPCKRLTPFLHSLASSASSYRIVRIDGTLNQVPGVDVVTFPTILYYKSAGSPPKVFKGNGEEVESWVIEMLKHG